MTQQVINIGAAPDDSTGDPLRTSFDKTNENFTELYAKGATEGLWNYNQTTTDTSTSPVSGRFRTNSGNYRDATQIAIHAITIQGIDRSSTLRTLLVGDLIQCQDSTNPAAWCRFGLQSLPVDHGTWFQLNVTLQADGGVASGDNQEIVFVFTAGGGGATASAPIGAEYITSSADATLTAERVLTNTATITWDFSTAGQAKASTTAGGGNVSNSGTPTVGQYAKWITATTIQGVAPATVLSDIGAAPLASPTFTGDPKAPTPATADNDTSIATTAYVQAQGYLTSAAATAAYQPLDADLTAIAALTGTNVIYYRSAANTWAAVTIGSNMTFSGGTLNSVAGGSGNVSNVGTPTAGQIAQWTDATHIQGIAVPNGPPQGRLTLQTATPVMITTQSAKTTIFYTPYVGNQIGLYNGTSMVPTAFTELSVLTTDTIKSPAAVGASQVLDWFVWSDAGTLRVGHGPAWTNDTTRSAGTALVMVNGVLLNNAAITNGPAAQRGTYVGTTRSNASSQLDWILGGTGSGGVAGWLGVWNCYNRVRAMAASLDNGSQYTYSSATIQQARASAGNQIQFVVGLVEDAIDMQYHQITGTAVLAGASVYWGIGVDNIGFNARGYNGASGSGASQGIAATVTWSSISHSIGWHTVYALEASDGNANFYGSVNFPARLAVSMNG